MLTTSRTHEKPPSEDEGAGRKLEKIIHTKSLRKLLPFFTTVSITPLRGGGAKTAEAESRGLSHDPSRARSSNRSRPIDARDLAGRITRFIKNKP